jgi:RNA polymerase sigma-70 factor (ECF subfamily)
MSTPIADSRRSHEAALAVRLRARDPLALDELYDLCGAPVYRLALRFVHDRATAEDLVQETFLYVWTRAAAFDPARGSLLQWVYLVARSRALDHVRSLEFRMSRRGAPLEAVPGGGIREAPAVLRADAIRLLQKPWSGLKSHERETLRLAHWGGLTQPEIAARLGRPLGTVKTWMRKGQRSLRAALEGALVY